MVMAADGAAQVEATELIRTQARRQSMVPAGTTHSHGWPVTRVIRSKSTS
jgi:hypothetical protein